MNRSRVILLTWLIAAIAITAGIWLGVWSPAPPGETYLI
jgi:hypothetical protein